MKKWIKDHLWINANWYGDDEISLFTIELFAVIEDDDFIACITFFKIKFLKFTLAFGWLP